MESFFKEVPNASTIAKLWTVFVIITLGFCLLLVEKTYYSLDAFGIWIFSCLALLYLARQKMESLKEKQKLFVILIGFLVCLWSFLSIPAGFSKPPYSIGEYAVLLSGIGLIIFGHFRMKNLLLPVSIPFIAIAGYEAYHVFLTYIDTLTAPLIPITITFTTLFLDLIGIRYNTNSNIITFISQAGSPLSVSIIGECTGLVSLGTFTVTLIIVLTSFPKSITKKSLGIIAIGYIGTYCANICRIVLIIMSGFFFGPTGIIEQVHVHIGWVLFSSWMIIFWYYFFTRHLGFTFFKKRSFFGK